MRKTWILVGIIMLIVTSYEIIKSYAKYVSEGEAVAEKQAGAWVIKVNDTNISNSNNSTTFNINNLVYPSNQYVVEGKMAPSSTGYFDIIIDPTGSSVAVRFDVTLDVQNLNIIDSLGFTNAYRVVNGVETSTGITQTGTNTYSGIISLNDVQNAVQTTVRFYLGWDEVETEEGDIADSQIGLTQNSSTYLPVRVDISQYLGEQLN